MNHITQNTHQKRLSVGISIVCCLGVLTTEISILERYVFETGSLIARLTEILLSKGPVETKMRFGLPVVER